MHTAPKQSAKLFLQSSELGLAGEGWGSPNSDEGAYTVVLYTRVYKYFVVKCPSQSLIFLFMGFV